MHEIDLLSIGSYTELPGGNIALPTGYSSVLAPILKVLSLYIYNIYRYQLDTLGFAYGGWN